MASARSQDSSSEEWNIQMAKKSALVGSVVDEEALYSRLKARLEAEQKQEADSRTLREVWEEWDRKVLSLSPADEGYRGDAAQTKSNTRHILDLKFEWRRKEPGGRTVVETICLGDVVAKDITILMADAWRLELRKLRASVMVGCKSNCRHRGHEPRPQTLRDLGRPISPSYRNRILSSLQSVLTFAFGKANNPLAGIQHESTKGRGRLGFFKDEDQLENWLDHAPTQYQRMARFAVQPGACRLTEARLLMEHEVTWDPEVRDVYLIPRRCKNRDGKRFHVSTQQYKVLESLRQTARVCTYADCEVRRCPQLAPEHWQDHKHLFASESHGDGRPVSKHTMGGWARKASAESGMRLGPKKERPSTHHLRHTAGSWEMFKTGGDVHMVATSGGWNNLKQVMGYAHRTEEMVQKALATSDLTMKEALARRIEAIKGNAKPEPPPTPRRAPRRSDRR